jgi:hypothetical protein
MDDEKRDETGEDTAREEPAPAEAEWTPLPSRHRLRGRGGFFRDRSLERPDDADRDDIERE